MGQIDFGDAVVLGLDPDHAAVIGMDAGDGVQVHAGGQGVAPLVVRVVSPQLRAAGTGVEGDGGVLIGPIKITKAVYKRQKPPGSPGGIVPVDTAQRVLPSSIVQSRSDFSDRLQSHPSSA